MSGASSEQVHELGRQMMASMELTEQAVKGMFSDLLPVLCDIEMILIYGTDDERQSGAEMVKELRQAVKKTLEGMR